MDTSGLFNKLAAGQDPGQLMGSAFSGPGAEALADLAKTTSEHAAELGAVGGAAPSVASGGSGASAASNSSGFNLGLGDMGPSQKSPSDQSFSPAAKPALASDDIWHTGYQGSIFDIITQKISSTRERVDSLDWSTPLNRALAGTSSQPRAKP
jgi:hypothetical protein